LADALQDLLGHVAVGGSGDDDDGPGPKGGADGRMGGQCPGNQAFSGGGVRMNCFMIGSSP